MQNAYGCDIELGQSWFQVPDDAVAVARKMLNPEGAGAEGYAELLSQFKCLIPENKQACFVEVGFDAVVFPWGLHDSFQRNYLTIYTPHGNIVAVISEDEVLHREDFAAIMEENGMGATSRNFGLLLQHFWHIAEPVGRSLRSSVVLSIEAVLGKDVVRDSQRGAVVDDVLADARNRRSDAARSNHGPELYQGLCREKHSLPF